ncbi:PREDICTED: trihelix transcription factor GT-3b-like isoform X2 [Nelumbo nucifera]|uniref:Trihelix transcription factor GT-3b-like isoform X2 n=1 Tax=Nelumbo nucifera TaxID=4432 RepID=A0A1U8ACN0_NELNU|nr:PREDICTED: trihelix transcription factor GT-3b-like isoform X2 [Nelumbo nucifera]
MEGHHLITVNVDTADRFPQWSLQETKEFLSIRAELDRTFMETKRNKLLWEVVSTKLKEKGYNRSADQCKCKWKNLVTRYKGCETIEPESMRQQFPFYNELQAIFTARMQRMLWQEAEGVVSSTNLKKKTGRLSSDDDDDESYEDKDSGRKKKKSRSNNSTGTGSSSSANNNLQEILEEFMRQQLQMEVQWREAVEAREEQRRLKEMEWREAMEALEKERLLMDRRWREIEEQRRLREEARAEKRDALITALLNKLRREDI